MWSFRGIFLLNKERWEVRRKVLEKIKRKRCVLVCVCAYVWVCTFFCVCVREREVGFGVVLDFL